jgi:hypothetical protein
MTEQSPEVPRINNEAAFIAAMGINPGVVKQGTVGIEFAGGTPQVYFTLIVPTDWKQLATAIAAGESGIMPEPSPEVAQPQDRTPPARRKPPAKKAPAKRGGK